MNQDRENDQSGNSKRLSLGEQLTLGLVIDVVFGFIVLAASAVAPNLTVWSILALASVAAVWVWARVVFRVKSAEAQAQKGANGAA
jgi:hypothetical protein